MQNRRDVGWVGGLQHGSIFNQKKKKKKVANAVWCKYRRLKCSETGRGRLERKKKEDVHLRRKEEAWDEHGFQQACQSWNCIWTACHCSLEGGTQATFLCPEPEQQVPLSLKPNAGATLITSRVQYTRSLDPHESSGSVHAKEGVAGLLKN